MGVLVGVGSAMAVPLQAPSAAAATPPADGRSSQTAAASCWSIKQDVPSSPDGVYWLQTPRLVAPQQFYCDMTTDGGGWVLVGRGREGWKWSDRGQGSPSSVRSTPSGPGAFAPAALSSEVVDGLLGGGRPDALADGVRVRRATNTDGTAWQEMRLRPESRDDWSWGMGGGLRLTGVGVDGTSYTGAYNTQNWGVDTAYRRLVTNEIAAHNYRAGWSFGSSVAGVNTSTSHLWTYGTENSAVPFSQVFLRPKISSSTTTYPSIPSQGVAAQAQRSLMRSQNSAATPWGVTGIYGAPGELNMEVHALAYIGQTLYVGGGFAYVQKGPNPTAAEKVQQSYLAAFDLRSGEWISGFRPKLDGMVWDLQATADGKLIVGGEFTNVNGTAGTTALAALDPQTGGVLPGWRADVTYPNTSGLRAQVRALDVQDGWLYVGGRFTRVAGGSSSTPITVSRAARVRVSDGAPDGGWKPHFDGSVIELDASERGDRVYFSGYFNNVNYTASANIGVVTTAAGAALTPGLAKWQPAIGSGKTYQQTIREVGNSVWQGGSEHSLQRYSRDTYAAQNFNITRAGGDFQAMTVVDGVVYAACHCGGFIYSGTNNFTNPIPTATDVTAMRYIAAWDAATGQVLRDFHPLSLQTRSGLGGWELMRDPYGCTWFGGDFTGGTYQANGSSWLGGFGKFCGRDTTPPTTPSSLQRVDGPGVSLSWNASTDASGPVSYEVMRNDRVIATTSTRTFTDPTPALPATYWVRAVDAESNRSASTAGLRVEAADTTPPAAPTGLQAVASPDRPEVKLTWTASTSSDVIGYRVVRNGAVLTGLLTSTSFVDTSVAASTDYRYAVRAYDAAGNAAESTPVDVRTSATSSAFQETFSAGDSATWPSSWTTTSNLGETRVQTGKGALALLDQSGAYARAVLTSGVDAADADVTFSYNWDSNAAVSYANVFLRGSGGWQNAFRPATGYGLQLSSNSSAAVLQKNVAGVTTTLQTVSAAQKVSTGKQWVRLRVQGSQVLLKTWVDGTPQPAAWTATVSDSAVTAPGRLFLSHVRGGTNVGAKTLQVDDLTYYRG